LGVLGSDGLEDFREDADAPFDGFLETEAALLAGFSSDGSEFPATVFDDLLEAEAALLAGFSEVSEVSTATGAGFLEAEAAALRGILGAAASSAGATGSEA
jgi:hypothetical protein